jgi:hypothetical protein
MNLGLGYESSDDEEVVQQVKSDVRAVICSKTGLIATNDNISRNLL